MRLQITGGYARRHSDLHGRYSRWWPLCSWLGPRSSTSVKGSTCKRSPGSSLDRFPRCSVQYRSTSRASAASRRVAICFCQKFRKRNKLLGLSNQPEVVERVAVGFLLLQIEVSQIIIHEIQKLTSQLAGRFWCRGTGIRRPPQGQSQGHGQTPAHHRPALTAVAAIFPRDPNEAFTAYHMNGWLEADRSPETVTGRHVSPIFVVRSLE